MSSTDDTIDTDMSTSPVNDFPSRPSQYSRSSSTSSAPGESSPCNPNPADDADQSESPDQSTRCRKRLVNKLPMKAHLQKALKLNSALCQQSASLKESLLSERESSKCSEFALQKTLAELDQTKSRVAELEEMLLSQSFQLQQSERDKKQLLQGLMTQRVEINKKDETMLKLQDYSASQSVRLQQFERENKRLAQELMIQRVEINQKDATIFAAQDYSTSQSFKLQQSERENKRLAQELMTQRVETSEKDVTISKLQEKVTDLNVEVVWKKGLLDQATRELVAEQDHQLDVKNQTTANPTDMFREDGNSLAEATNEFLVKKHAEIAEKTVMIEDLEAKVEVEASGNLTLQKHVNDLEQKYGSNLSDEGLDMEKKSTEGNDAEECKIAICMMERPLLQTSKTGGQKIRLPRRKLEMNASGVYDSAF